MLFTYQGELSRESHLYIWPNHLLGRALFLKDYDAYLYFSNYVVCRSVMDNGVLKSYPPYMNFLQDALQTGEIRVMARALSMLENQHSSSLLIIIDLELLIGFRD